MYFQCNKMVYLFVFVIVNSLKGGNSLLLDIIFSLCCSQLNKKFPRDFFWEFLIHFLKILSKTFVVVFIYLFIYYYYFIFSGRAAVWNYTLSYVGCNLQQNR